MAIRQERPDTASSTPELSGSEATTAVDGTDTLSGSPEPWEDWETRLVVWSLAIGFAGLLVLGWLVDRFILP